MRFRPTSEKGKERRDLSAGFGHIHACCALISLEVIPLFIEILIPWGKVPVWIFSSCWKHSEKQRSG